MADDLIPLGDATASDIRDLTRPGLVLPLRKNDPALLVIDLSGQMHAVKLTGDHAFSDFPIKLDTSRTGLFVPEPEILVDLDSATNGLGLEEDRGVLLLEQNTLSVVAKQVGDHHFDDARPLPLWKNIAGGSNAAKVAFTHWGLGVRDRDGFRTLWAWKKLRKSTVEFS